MTLQQIMLCIVGYWLIVQAFIGIVTITSGKLQATCDNLAKVGVLARTATVLLLPFLLPLTFTLQLLLTHQTQEKQDA